MKIGFVTCIAEKLKYYFPTIAEPDFIPTEPPFTPDDQLAVDYLRSKNFQVEAVVWGSPIDILHSFDLVIVRSPWDYMDTDEQRIEFLDWIGKLEKSGVRVSNPVKFMQWMLDKHYLQNFADEGISVIPTDYYEIGSKFDLPAIYAKQGPFVMKPCISAAGVGLYFISSEQDAHQFQDETNNKLKSCSYMVQHFVKEVKTNGEWSLVFLGGVYSHAVHKKPGPEENSIMVHAERGGSLNWGSPPQHIIQFAEKVYSKALPAFKKATNDSFDPSLVLYLRIDVIDTEKYGPVVVECEGVEPELFFRATKDSTEKFYNAIAKLFSQNTK